MCYLPNTSPQGLGFESLKKIFKGTVTQWVSGHWLEFEEEKALTFHNGLLCHDVLQPLVHQAEAQDQFTQSQLNATRLA